VVCFISAPVVPGTVSDHVYYKENGPHQSGSRLQMEEINIECGMPTVDVAMSLLTERLRSLKKSCVKAVTVVTGPELGRSLKLSVIVHG
jgi:hypothetical protein